MPTILIHQRPQLHIYNTSSLLNLIIQSLVYQLQWHSHSKWISKLNGTQGSMMQEVAKMKEHVAAQTK